MSENMTVEKLRELGAERTRDLKREQRFSGVPIPDLRPSRKIPSHLKDLRIAEEPWYHVAKVLKDDIGLSDEDLAVGEARATGRFGDSLTNYLKVTHEIHKNYPDLYQPKIIEALRFLEDLVYGGFTENRALRKLAAQGYLPEDRRKFEESIRLHFPDYN